MLLNNFSLNNTKLHEANKLFIFALNEVSNLLDSIQQYTTQLITIIESMHTELITT